ncbi:MAG: universal stress protein [Verrucomicrobiota bacterium]
MKRYQKVMVPLEISDSDNAAISWASKVSKMANSQEILFIHAVEVADIPDATKEKYPWLLKPLDETLLDRMKAKVEAIWDGNPEAKIDFKVTDSKSVILSILEEALKQESDLVIIGRDAFGSDVAVRLARKAPCSVMVVPTEIDRTLEKIVVANDFSEPSVTAFDVATAFAKAEGLSEIDSLHIFSVGQLTHRAAIPESELIQISLDHAMEVHKEHLSSVASKEISIRPNEAHSKLVPQDIVSEATKMEADLIVTGCRGRNTLVALLLGSNAEELLKISPVPIIAVKEKGTGQKLIEALIGS